MVVTRYVKFLKLIIENNKGLSIIIPMHLAKKIQLIQNFDKI